eukprot:421292_1
MYNLLAFGYVRTQIEDTYNYCIPNEIKNLCSQYAAIDFNYKSSTIMVDKYINTITCIKDDHNYPNCNSTSFGLIINANSNKTCTVKIKINKICDSGGGSYPIYIGIIGEDDNISTTNTHLTKLKGYHIGTQGYRYDKITNSTEKIPLRFGTGDILVLTLNMNELSLLCSKNNGQSSVMFKKGQVKRLSYKWGVSMYRKGDKVTIISISQSKPP